MKKSIVLVTLILLAALLISACTQDTNESINSEDNSEASSEQSSEESTVEEYVFTGTEQLNNLTMKNTGKMGDKDGPAYCVYSKIGYNKASFEIELSKIDMDITRNGDDEHHVNAYIFLGVDVYDPTGQWWYNCVDAGLVYASATNGWHVFYNMYTSTDPNKYKWYESSKTLNKDHDYKLVLDSSNMDGLTTLTVYDLTTNKIADKVTFELAYSLKDGSNTAYLMDFALDYPSNIKLDTEGKPSENWIEITKYNSDVGIKFNNIRIKNATLTKDGTESTWTADHTQNRGIWPDSSMNFDYACTSVHHIKGDYEFIIDLDMNRK